MCGRYELSSHPAAIALAFGLPHPPQIAPRYNIAPTQQVPIVRLNGSGERELAQVRWGLVPRWAKDPAIGVRMINARGETLTTKSAFRNAFARHRCLLPVNGFYEWHATRAGKQPMHVGMRDGRPFGLAGLYERWLSPDGDVLDTCTIVTTSASDELRGLHDRMPVIVPADAYARWLDAASGDVDDLVAPWSGEPLCIYPVSTRVNAVRNDDERVLDPVDASRGEPATSAQADVPDVELEPAGDEPPEEDAEPVQASLF